MRINELKQFVDRTVTLCMTDGETAKVTEFLFSPQLRGGFHSGWCRLAEEADQALEVLSSRRQEELLPHKP